MPHSESYPPVTEPPGTLPSAGSAPTVGPFTPTGPPLVPGFELGDEIGQGGMGVVYAARDLEVGRDVAVKLLRPENVGHESSARRFVEEAQITGQLQHPGIPAVYRVGTLADGSPFLAMKLVKGYTLADLLRDRESPAADRSRFVAVFEGVCQAVGYAHAHGVIHRDLKPQNVMVGAFGEVQVVDWGLAKVLASGGVALRPSDPSIDTAPDTIIRSARDQSDATQAGSHLGTPAYMPPEQAIGAVDKIDQRSDVFGLGGILCTILTGKPPYVGDSAESTRQLAARAKLDDAFAHLAGCGADADLVALCKRCLSPLAADRPADAGVVAGAVAELRAAADERARQAELASEREAVRSAEERKRRRVLVGAAAVLALGTAVAVWQAVRATAAEATARDREGKEAAARAEAETQRTAAVEQERAATAAKEFLQSVLDQGSADGQATKDRTANPKLTMKEAIDFAATEIAGRFDAQPQIEADLRMTLGRAYHGMGHYADAEPHLRRALALYEDTLGPDHRNTLRAVNNLAYTHQAKGEFPAAEPLFQRSLAGRERTLGPDHPDTLTSANNLAFLRRWRGDFPAAETLYRRALAGREKILGPTHSTTLGTVNNLAELQLAKGDAASAEELYRRAYDGLVKSLGPDHPNTLTAANNLAYLYVSMGEFARAEELYRRALAGQEKVLGTVHPDTLRTVNNLAALYQANGDFPKAEPLFQRALAGREKVLGPNHPDTLTSAFDLGVLYTLMRKGESAIPLFDRYLAWQRNRLGSAGPAFAGYLAQVASYLLLADQFAAAERHLRACLAIREAAQPDGWSTFNTRSMLGEALLGQGKIAEAEPLLLGGFDGMKQREKTIPMVARGRLGEAVDRLAALSDATARPADAAKWRADRKNYPPPAAPPPRASR